MIPTKLSVLPCTKPRHSLQALLYWYEYMQLFEGHTVLFCLLGLRKEHRKAYSVEGAVMLVKQNQKLVWIQ